ncbi:MAG: deoxynucleoside kinase [Tunicatimonas sp.]
MPNLSANPWVRPGPSRLHPVLIAISGNIGAGKSTLTQRLADHYGYRADLESVRDNPYLDDFYLDMARWAFPLQIYFLNQRFRQARRVAPSDEGVVMDRTLYEDAEIFAANLRQLGHLSERDYQNYRGLYDTMLSFVRLPDLLIYLRGSVPTLQARIQQRYRANPPARANENRIPADYLQHLNERYDAWVQSFSLAPVFTIPIDSVDLAQSAQFAALVGRIDQWRNVARRAAAPNHTS